MPKPDGTPKPAAMPELLRRLSTKRQEIIRPILEHPRAYVLLSVRDLATRLRTDPATMIRIVNALGFRRYKDFQRHLHEISLAFATSADTMRKEPGGSSRHRAEESLERDLKNLQGLRNSLDSKRFEKVAKRFYEARRIVVVGGDVAAVLAEYVGYQLNLLGLPVYMATGAGQATHSVRCLNAQDVVLAMTFRRGLRSTIESTETAKGKGAYCVGIADTSLSPLTAICDEMFLASTQSVSYGTSFTAPIALLNVLITVTGTYRLQRTMQIVRELDHEQRNSYRWYTPDGKK